jgi:poly(A)-specific ribonuclease
MGAPASHSSAGAAPPLQVTRTNFKQALPAIQEALAGCQFYAFDCEMTGLRLQGQDDWFLDDPEERYARTKAAAEQFLVTQFGLCTFTWTGAGYSARSFNIALFPLPWEDLDARFTCQASALVFLVNQGFDFNKVGAALACIWVKGWAVGRGGSVRGRGMVVVACGSALQCVSLL